MAIDSATAEFLAQLAAGGGKPLHESTPQEARAMGPMLTQLQGPGPEMARVEDLELTAEDANTFRIRVLVPGADPAAVIVYYHGGGWVVGDIDQYDNLGRQLAQRTGNAVVLVDYRKAPEHRYPAAVDDSWQALLWVDAHLDEIAGRRVPLIVAGDSAGGNLAAVMTQRARDRSGPALSLQVLIYPVTDDDVSSRTYVLPENQLLLTKESMVWFWDHYTDPAQRADVDVSPLKAADLTCLPPAVVLIAEHDVLRAEGEAYAAALEAAGVPVQLRLFEGQMHGFYSMVNLLPASAAGLDYTAEQIGRHLSSVTS